MLEVFSKPALETKGVEAGSRRESFPSSWWSESSRCCKQNIFLCHSGETKEQNFIHYSQKYPTTTCRDDLTSKTLCCLFLKNLIKSDQRKEFNLMNIASEKSLGISLLLALKSKHRRLWCAKDSGKYNCLIFIYSFSVFSTFKLWNRTEKVVHRN